MTLHFFYSFLDCAFRCSFKPKIAAFFDVPIMFLIETSQGRITFFFCFFNVGRTIDKPEKILMVGTITVVINYMRRFPY